jgi:poly-gamma-glutamate synthesis protein (capsule biosynthesis protein)
MARTLRAADLSIVNLETAVTTRGKPQPKEFTFRAPPAAFTALRAAGVDVTTMANNHGLDYGPESVPDALAAAEARSMPLIGIGENTARAYAPWIVSVHGQRIAFLAATAFLVPQSLVPSWSAGPHRPGLAMAMPGRGARLVAAVRQVRPLVDTLVVDMHWGNDALQQCPTPWQRTLAGELTAAGADIVVGQHEHILQGAGYLGSAYVAYGLGNFQFYVPNGGETAQTGVLVLTVDGRRVTNPRWVPGEIVDGLPTPLGGAAANAEQQRWSALRGCAGLAARPGAS